MRVLLSAYACMPNAGSEPGNGWNWATSLAERGMEVTVLTRAESKPELEAYLRDHVVPHLKIAYVDVPLPLCRPASALHYTVWQIRAVRVARALHAGEPFDIVHHVTYASIHLPTRLWRLGVPTIFGPVGGGQISPSSMLTYFGARQTGERIRTLLTRALRYSPMHRRWLKKMSLVLAANDDTLELARCLGRTDARFTRDMGTNAGYLAERPHRYGDDSTPIRLLWVARLLPRKALPLALDALAQTTRPVALTIVGYGLSAKQVNAMISSRGLNDRVQWAGRRLSHEELRTAYKEHDALLFTSLRDTAGVQLLEAMATALPIITLNLHGARELVPDSAGYKIPVSTPAEVVCALARAIDQFVDLSPEDKGRMSATSLAFAQTCTWQLKAEAAEALYREVLLPKEAQHSCWVSSLPA